MGTFLARSGQHTPGTHDLNIGLASLSEAVDLTTSSGRAMAVMLSVFAAFERDILRYRVRAGLDHARQSGTRLGRPSTAAIKAAEVRKLFRRGISKSEISGFPAFKHAQRKLTISHVCWRRALGLFEQCSVYLLAEGAEQLEMCEVHEVFGASAAVDG